MRNQNNANCQSKSSPIRKQRSWLRWLNLLLGGILSVLSFGSCKIHIFPPANLYGVPNEYYQENNAELRPESEDSDTTQTHK